ncbi:MAG: molybdate ABC transporter substrate-binding protein [Desulfovibrio sp.]|nr:molybdate ABC transporter substrate-binding protein [Desulfovibrio sp.]MBI4959228.1 molybdate ABC transporter substrate-binding protein [Desulfovibrio sp.]
MKKFFVLPMLLFTMVLGSSAEIWAQSVTVSGAASLTAAFTGIKQAFEKANPGFTVHTNFAASGALLAQIEAGAPVDVFASADQETMDRAQAKDLIVKESRKDFVANSLVLARPKTGGGKVTSLQDLSKPEVARIGMGQPETVPVGRYTREALMAAGLWDSLQQKLIFGNNVKQVLDYLTRAEVDAGFVFATDAMIAKDSVEMVAAIPTKSPVLYPLAIVQTSKDKQAAEAFVQFVLSSEGQAILAKYGFQKP